MDKEKTEKVLELRNELDEVSRQYQERSLLLQRLSTRQITEKNRIERLQTELARLVEPEQSIVDKLTALVTAGIITKEQAEAVLGKGGN